MPSARKTPAGKVAPKKKSSKLTYKGAGVDTHGAAALVGDIASLVASTQKHRQLANAFGLFAAAYDLGKYKHPMIVTGADGVGTKLEVLLEYDLLETAGKDLVAMNVNDVLTTGGDPVMFLDYIGIGRIEKQKITRLVAGMAEWCAACHCILAGGETAGNFAAVLSAFGFAVFTLTLRWGKLEDMMPAVVLGGLFSMAVAVIVLGVRGEVLAVPVTDIVISVAMGAGMLATGMALYTLGSRVVPAAELTLLSMVEVLLAPVWVWLILGETASAGTFLGGGILLLAIAGNALSGLRRKPVAPPLT